MKRSTLRLITCAVAGVVSLAAQQTLTAAEYTWAGGSGTNKAWNTTTNWTKTGGGTGYPNTAGDVVNLNINYTAASSANTDSGAPTLGVLNWGDSTSPYVTMQIGTYNGAGAVTFDNNGSGAQINHGTTGVAVDNFRSNITLLDNLTISLPAAANTTNGIKLWGSITGSYGITKTGLGRLQIEPAGGASSWSGLTQLQGGNLSVSANGGNVAIPGNIQVSGPTSPSSAATKLQSINSNAIASTANIDFLGGIWNMGGVAVDQSTGYQTIASLSSSSITANSYDSDIYSGVLTLAATSGSTSYVGRFGYNSTIDLKKTGGSTQTFAGTKSNAFTTVSVTGGTLQLNKTAGVDALSGAITLGDGAGNGRIRLMAANQIANASTITMNAGTLDTNGLSEKVATLANSGASTIDMGAGTSILAFDNSNGQSWSDTIQILNWSGSTDGGGTDQLIFGTDGTGLSAAQLAMISFVDPTNYAPGTYGATILPTTGEVVAVVPEPAILGTMALSGLLVLRRRRTR